MKIRRGFLSCTLLVGICVPGLTGIWHTAWAATVSCADLAKQSFSDLQFNKPVAFASAKVVEANGPVPQHCEVRGTVWPEIQFVFKIPTAYNERLVQVGTGATAGFLPEPAMPPFLSKGFAVIGTNTGHVQGPPFNESWTIQTPENPNANQKVIDYAYRANHEVANLGKKILRVYKGGMPKYSYWSGCSNGGREGLVEAQMYPEDFDGYVIGAPPYNIVQSMIGYIWKGAKFQNVPKSKLCLQAKYVYDKCDKYDGVVDGLIGNPLTCDFDPMKELPACPNDVDGPACWTTAQRRAIKDLYTGLKTSWGTALDVGVVPGTEVCTDPANPETSGWLGFATAAPLGQAVIKYIVLKNPNFDFTTFNYDIDPFAILTRPEMQWLRADRTDLTKVKSRGAKILSYYGWAERTQPPNAIDYYEALARNMGGISAVNSFYKLYFVPGMFHCRGGVGCGEADFFTPLQNWVEKGVEPGTIKGFRTATKTLTARTRPLCPYPQIAYYKGSGSIDDGNNFVCGIGPLQYP